VQWLTSPEAWAALLSLTALEIVLGVDNIIFISILVARLPAEQRQRARVIGLALAMVMRIGLLLSLAWMMRLTDPLVSVYSTDISGRDLILIGGGLFLLAKSRDGDPLVARGRRGRGMGTPRRRFLRHARADRHHRHRFLARFSHYRGGHGERVPVMVLAIVIAVPS
jgi:predicted tellurium resistance membrane protein TerC